MLILLVFISESLNMFYPGMMQILFNYMMLRLS